MRLEEDRPQPALPVAQWLPHRDDDPFSVRASRYRRITLLTDALCVALPAISLMGGIALREPWILLAALLASLALKFVVDRYANPEKVELVRLPLQEQEFALRVKLEICQDGAITGRDSGWLWVQDRAVFFAGVGCSFIISGANLRQKPWFPKRLESFTPGSGFDVYCDRKSRQIRLHFAFLDPDVPPARIREVEAATIAARAPGPSKWDTILPPLDLGQGINPYRYDGVIVLFGIFAALPLILVATLEEASLMAVIALVAASLAAGRFGVWPLMQRRKILRQILTRRRETRAKPAP